MDYAASLTEAQQQLLAQYQQHLQQQQQPSQQAVQPYDPSQAYDPTAQAYYSYSQAYQSSAAHAQQQTYPYYATDYSNTAAANGAYQQTSQPDSTTQTLEGMQSYYPQDQLGPYGASATAAVAEQQQYAAADPPSAGGQHRGGRRGGRPFRGGKGNFGHRGGAPPFRGRGRGRGGGRRFPQSAPAVASPYPGPESEPYAGPDQVSAQVEALAPAPAPAPALAPAPTALRRPPTVVFCDLCRVDCNSMEIFEKHKIGKRHKKNLQRLEEMQNQKLVFESGSQQKAAGQLENVQAVEEKALVPESLPRASLPENIIAATLNENKQEGEQQIQAVEQCEIIPVPTEESAKRKRDDTNILRNPPKQTKFGWGGKRMRADVSRSEAPKELPVHCALCNVTCDTMAVFQCHLQGKKHASRAKRSHGQSFAYVPPPVVGLHAVYLPHSSSTSSNIQGQASATGQGGHQAGMSEVKLSHVSEPDQKAVNLTDSVPPGEYGISSMEHAVAPGLNTEAGDP